MKNIEEQKLLAPTDRTAPVIPHFHIYRQTHTGIFSPGLKSNSAHEIVEAFLNQSRAFEDGGLQIWNHREQRVSASVKWNAEKTEFGFPVFHRTNVFHDGLLGLIARWVQLREEIREEIQASVWISA